MHMIPSPVFYIFKWLWAHWGLFVIPVTFIVGWRLGWAAGLWKARVLNLKNIRQLSKALTSAQRAETMYREHRESMLQLRELERGVVEDALRREARAKAGIVALLKQANASGQDISRLIEMIDDGVINEEDLR